MADEATVKCIDADAELAVLRAALAECKKRPITAANVLERKRLTQRFIEVARETSTYKEEAARLATEGLPLNWLRRNRLAFWIWRFGYGRSVDD
jgi:hypothetical protein